MYSTHKGRRLGRESIAGRLINHTEATPDWFSSFGVGVKKSGFRGGFPVLPVK
jgi:hypothetical protein